MLAPPLCSPLTHIPLTMLRFAAPRQREYPDPAYDFIGRLRRATRANAHLTDEKDVTRMLNLGEHIRKGESRLCVQLQRRAAMPCGGADIDGQLELQSCLGEKIGS